MAIVWTPVIQPDDAALINSLDVIQTKWIATFSTGLVRQVFGNFPSMRRAMSRIRLSGVIAFGPRLYKFGQGNQWYEITGWTV